MKYTESTDPVTGISRVTVEIHPLEMVAIRLDHFDHLILDKCNKSSSVADKLLALETIARRIEEQT